MKRNILDRTIGFFSPKAEARRVAYRRRTEVLEKGKRGFEAAGAGRRTDDWFTRPVTNDEFRRSGHVLRERSRDLDRNNAVASLANTRQADYHVGTGIMPKSRTKTPDLDTKVDELWAKFAKRIDPEGILNFDGLCHKAFRMMCVDGEVLARRRDRRISDGLEVPLQVQLLEAEFLDAKKHGPANGRNYDVNGIRFDAIGGRRGYHIFPQHPLSSMVLYGVTSSLVSADEVIHLFEPRGNQVRGTPWLAPVMLDLKDLDEYNEAELVRKKIEACNVGFVKRNSDDEDDEDPNIGLPDDRDGYVDRDETATDKFVGVHDGFGDPVERFEPGMFVYGREGDEIQFNNPSVSAGHEAFLRSNLRRVSAGARLPYELLTNDLSQVTFASGKLGLLAYQRFVRTNQWNLFIPRFCQRIWEWFINRCIIMGDLPDQVYPVEWTVPRFESITPIDDTRSDMLEVRNGFKSWDEAVTERGLDPDAVIANIIARNKTFDDAEGSPLIFDCDPRRVAINGQMQWVPEQQTDNPPRSQS